MASGPRVPRGRSRRPVSLSRPCRGRCSGQRFHLLYISGSNRKKNCYKLLLDLKSGGDTLIALADKNIHYCLGCISCINNLEEYCVIDDDMREIYHEMKKADKIVIATPIYMNHISGILKNVIDRLMPYYTHDELLKGKTVYIITVGQMDEEENEEIADNIKTYFESLAEEDFIDFNVVFLRNLSSGDIETIDDVTKNYDNYYQIIEELKQKIEK